MRCRRGFTLIEMLIIFAIIAILIAFLLAAVQQVRHRAARLYCSNNLKQIGLAAHQFHGMHKVFPAGIRYQQYTDPYPYMTWLTQLLPYIDQESLWDASIGAYQRSHSPFNDPPHTPLSSVVPLFICPLDYRLTSAQLSLETQTLVAFTSYLGVSGNSVFTQDGVFYRDSQVRLLDITDGSSQTLMAGQRFPEFLAPKWRVKDRKVMIINRLRL